MENAVDVLSGIYYDYMQNKLGKGGPIEKTVENLMFDFRGKDVDGLAIYAVPAAGKIFYRYAVLDKKGKAIDADEKTVGEFIKKNELDGPVYVASLMKKKNIANMPFNMDEKLEGGRSNIVFSPVKIYGKADAKGLKELAKLEFESKAATWIALQDFACYSKNISMIDRIRGHFVTVPAINAAKGEVFVAVFWGKIEKRIDDSEESIRVYLWSDGKMYDEDVRSGLKKQYGEYCSLIGDEAKIFFMTDKFIDLASKKKIPVVEDRYFKEWETLDIKTCAKISGPKAWKIK